MSKNVLGIPVEHILSGVIGFMIFLLVWIMVSTNENLRFINNKFIGYMIVV